MRHWRKIRSAHRLGARLHIIRDAKSWGEFHSKLDARGLRFEKKGSGVIIFVGDIAVKASSVDRVFSMGKLCKRLGEFKPGDYPEKKVTRAPESVSANNHYLTVAYGD